MAMENNPERSKKSQKILNDPLDWENIRRIRALFAKEQKISPECRSLFQAEIYRYFSLYKRDFPWRYVSDPYKVFISEMMLQQTTTQMVEKKFSRFIRKWPDFQSLARAPQDEILREWKGLGYNRRALWLKESARQIVEEFGGILPDDPKILRKLKGIGEATAGEICAFAFNKPVVIVNEVNIKRVYIFFFLHSRPVGSIKNTEIKDLVELTLDKDNPRDWYYALMDYGAYLKTRFPDLLKKSRTYKKQAPFTGSMRQLRGFILTLLLENSELSNRRIEEKVIEKFGTRFSNQDIQGAIEDLHKEGFIALKRMENTKSDVEITTNNKKKGKFSRSGLRFIVSLKKNA